MPANTKNKILILGDSTIDNRVWLGKEKYHLFARGFSPKFSPLLSKLINFLYFFNPFKSKSVVENLKAQMPDMEIIDRTNDGFTTQSILKGDYKDKVFGRGAHRFFPHEMFKPLETNEVENADQIILSIGGNNLREFMLKALNIKDASARKDYIKNEYPIVLEKMQEDYQTILKEITRRNTKAKIILMTQYYPAFNQKMLININLYDFMTELGEALGKGTATNAIVDVLKDAYKGILTFINSDESMSKRQISMVDVTSSLNPHFNEHYEGQIEPSDIGGRAISHMLSYVINDDKALGKRIYRFAPEYFNSYANKADHVITCDITANTNFTPVHPNNMLKNVQYNWKRKAMILAVGILGGAAASLMGAGIALTSIAVMIGAVIGYKAAKIWHIGFQVSSNLATLRAPYEYEASAAYKANEPLNESNEMEEFGVQAANGWFPYLKSCLPLSGAYHNADFNKGYTKALQNRLSP